MAKEGKNKIEKFNEKSYQHWKMQIEDYLYQMDLCLPLEGIEKEAYNHKREMLGRTLTERS